MEVAVKTKGIEVPRVENLIQSLLLLQGLISSKLCSSLSRSWLRREHNGFMYFMKLYFISCPPVISRFFYSKPHFQINQKDYLQILCLTFENATLEIFCLHCERKTGRLRAAAN